MTRSLRLALLAPLLVAAGCGGGGGDGSTDGGGRDTTVLPGCATSADCRGGELCVDGSCREACGEGDPCLGPLPGCDLSRGICVTCVGDRDCMGGQLCVDQECVTVCTGDGDCRGGELCNRATGRCEAVECARDTDCAGGEVCTGGACVPVGGPECVVDRDCPGGYRCEAPGRCVPAGPDAGMDAGGTDAGRDAGGVDSGPVDGGPTDTGPTDTGPADTGPADTGPADTGPADTGVSCTSISCGAVQRCCGGLCVNRDVPVGTAGRDDSSFDHCGGCDRACDVDTASACSRPSTGALPQCMCGSGAACTGGRVCVPAGTSFVCTDLATDPANCGEVGNACAEGEDCIAGECRCGVFPACAAGQACCSDACVDIRTNVAHCGGCGMACGAQANRCAGGECLCGTEPACAAPTGGGIGGGGLGELCCGPAGSKTCVAQSNTNCTACGVGCTSPQTCQVGLLTSEVCCTDSAFGCGFGFP